MGWLGRGWVVVVAGGRCVLGGSYMKGDGWEKEEGRKHQLSNSQIFFCHEMIVKYLKKIYIITYSPAFTGMPS